MGTLNFRGGKIISSSVTYQKHKLLTKINVTTKERNGTSS